MERIYNIARGISELEVRGTDPERILNAMAQAGIEFWQCVPIDAFCIRFKIHSADHPAIKAMRGLSGLEIKVLSSRGGERMAKKLKGRIALLLCLALFSALLGISSLFIWNIEVEGNDKISDAEIIRALSDCGISYGTFRYAVSSDLARSQMLLKLEDISWLTVNLRNSKAEVIVHERIKKPEIYDKNAFGDVVAAKSGIITKMSVFEGERRVSVGDTVTEGDVLVSGLCQSETGDDRLTHAKADIEARTWQDITAVTPLYQSFKTDTRAVKRRISLVFGKNVINFCADSRNTAASCDKIIKYKDASVNSVFALPIGIIAEKEEIKNTEKRRIDVEAETARLKEDLMRELERRLDGGKLVRHSFSISEDNGLLTVTIHAECIENISIERTKDK